MLSVFLTEPEKEARAPVGRTLGDSDDDDYNAVVDVIAVSRRYWESAAAAYRLNTSERRTSRSNAHTHRQQRNRTHAT